MDNTFMSIIILCYFVIFYVNESLPLTAIKTYTIENDKICSLVKKRQHIHLGKYNTSSILIKETRYFDVWLGDHYFICKFKVEADGAPENGVFAVIQNLSMRKDPITGLCIDYVQFRASDEQWGPKICGKISARSLEMSELLPSESISLELVLAPYAYIDSDGRMDVNIYVANKRLEHDENIDMDISFTSYKTCGKSERYKSCLEDQDSRLYCIWKGFFHDSIVNCPFHNCPDEGGCQQVEGEGPSHGSSPAVVTGAAVATLLIAFGSFLACIWLLRKLHLLCWSFPGNVRQTPVVEFSGQGALEEFSATAPTTDESPQPVSPDKDLPPAYDTLFPPKQT